MITIQDVLTGKAIIATNRYRSLKTTTAMDAGHETLSVQVDAMSTFSGNAEIVWRGQIILVQSIDGPIWEGVIDQVQKAEGYWNILAVGHSAYELTMNPLLGVYYADLLDGYKEIESPWFSSKIEQDTGLHLDMAKDSLIVDAERGGLEWNTPFKYNTDGNIRWLSIVYKRLEIPSFDTGTMDFRVYGVNGVTETLLSSVALNTVDSSVQVLNWTNTTGIQRLRFVLVKTGGTGTLSSETQTFVQISRVEASLLESRPMIQDVLEHIFSRNSQSNITVAPNLYLSTAQLIAPVIADGTQDAGQKAIVELRRQAELHSGTPWFFGTWGKRFETTRLHRTRWRITSRDVGQESFFNANRMSPSIGSFNIVTQVMAHYTDEDGIGQFTDWYPTGLRLPRERVEIIEASSADTADDEAAAHAAQLGSDFPDASFVMTANARLEKGGFRSVTMVRAFDWAVVDSVTLGTVKTAEDTTRGSYISKTSYDGETQEMTVELIG